MSELDKLFTALLNTTVGFDRLNLQNRTTPVNYPPHNIVRIDDNNYQIIMAVAGFERDELEVIVHNGELSITGKPKKKEVEEPVFLYRGLSNRQFKLTFPLDKYIEVYDVSLKDGLLIINMERNIPEEKQPKLLTIS